MLVEIYLVLVLVTCYFIVKGVENSSPYLEAVAALFCIILAYTSLQIEKFDAGSLYRYSYPFLAKFWMGMFLLSLLVGGVILWKEGVRELERAV